MPSQGLRLMFSVVIRREEIRKKYVTCSGKYPNSSSQSCILLDLSWIYIWRFPKLWGTPKSSICNRIFSKKIIINHPAIGVPQGVPPHISTFPHHWTFPSHRRPPQAQRFVGCWPMMELSPGPPEPPCARAPRAPRAPGCEAKNLQMGP